MSQGKVFSDSSIQALNAILRRLPELGQAEVNYLVERLTAMKKTEDVGQ